MPSAINKGCTLHSAPPSYIMINGHNHKHGLSTDIFLYSNCEHGETFCNNGGATRKRSESYRRGSLIVFDMSCTYIQKRETTIKHVCVAY